MRAKSLWIGSLLALLIGLTVPTHVHAEHPPAPKLLPQRTLAYFRIANVQDMIGAFGKTAFGRMFKDPKIRPLIGDLYKQGAAAFTAVEKQLGLSLDQLLRIPQGEFAIAYVAPEKGSGALVALLEVGKESANANKLLDKFAAGLAIGGYKTKTEKQGNTKLTIHSKPDAGFLKEIVLFERDKTIYFITDLELAKQTLKVWEGADFNTLSDNKNFVGIMKKCLGTKDERPQVTFFVDPIEIVKVAGQDNFGLQLAISTFPRLGLDALKGIGGSMIFDAKEFDSIMHFHILTQGQRRGILKMIALEPADLTPERFAPADVASYMTLSWNLQTTIKLVSQTIDGFRGEGTTSKFLQNNLSKNLGVDVEKDIIAQLGKRFTMMSHVVQKGAINGTSAFFALEVQNGKEFKATIDKVLNKIPQGGNIKRKRFGGATIYEIPLPTPRRFNEKIMRKPEAFLAIINNYVAFCDSAKFLHHVIRHNNGQGKNLAGELDFKLIQQQIGRQVKAKQPAMIVFSRPGPVFEAMYDLVYKEEERKKWATLRRPDGTERSGGGARFIRLIDQALTKNPLPPFKTIEKYLPTGGALMSVDDSGFHYTAFSLKRE